jgi:hypothetical protein
VAPTGALAGLAGLADEHHEEIEAMASGAHEAVRAGSCCVAEGGQELEEDGCRISLRVRSNRADDLTGKTVQGLLAKLELRGLLQWGRTRLGRWFGLRLRRVLK